MSLAGHRGLAFDPGGSVPGPFVPVPLRAGPSPGLAPGCSGALPLIGVRPGPPGSATTGLEGPCRVCRSISPSGSGDLRTSRRAVLPFPTVVMPRPVAATSRSSYLPQHPGWLALPAPAPCSASTRSRPPAGFRLRIHLPLGGGVAGVGHPPGHLVAGPATGPVPADPRGVPQFPRTDEAHLTHPQRPVSRGSAPKPTTHREVTGCPPVVPRAVPRSATLRARPAVVDARPERGRGAVRCARGSQSESRKSRMRAVVCSSAHSSVTSGSSVAVSVEIAMRAGRCSWRFASAYAGGW